MRVTYYICSMICLYGWPSLHMSKTQQIQGGQALHHKSCLRILVNKFDCCLVHITFAVWYICMIVPLDFVGHWRYARRDIHTDISYCKYNMYQTTIKLVYKYSEAKLMMQSLSFLDLLGFGGMQGESSIQTYHTTNIICTKQQSNLFTSILRLDLCCKACPTRICCALEVHKEGHS